MSGVKKSGAPSSGRSNGSSRLGHGCLITLDAGIYMWPRHFLLHDITGRFLVGNGHRIRKLGLCFNGLLCPLLENLVFLLRAW